MPRILFEKKGNSIWISHLDLMRVFQRAFKRAGLPLTHTQGFNPRPSVSIALPLSVGIESNCEFLDFDLDGDKIPNEEIKNRLNSAMIEGIRILDVYDDFLKIKNIAFLDCSISMEYDREVSELMIQRISGLFANDTVIVEKKSKNGISEQNIIPMIRLLNVTCQDVHTILIHAKICCQNPTLNPMQIPAAIEKYLPECAADHVTCCRNEVYDYQDKVFR